MISLAVSVAGVDRSGACGAPAILPHLEHTVRRPVARQTRHPAASATRLDRATRGAPGLALAKVLGVGHGEIGVRISAGKSLNQR